MPSPSSASATTNGMAQPTVTSARTQRFNTRQQQRTDLNGCNRGVNQRVTTNVPPVTTTAPLNRKSLNNNIVNSKQNTTLYPSSPNDGVGTGPIPLSSAPQYKQGEPNNNNKFDHESEIPNEAPWQTVEKRKDRRRSYNRQVIHGNGTPDANLQAVERVKRIHVCFLKHETTTETLMTYMNRISPSSDYHIEKLTLRHEYYASFIVTVPSSKYDFFMSAENWPPQIEVSPWFHRSDGRAMRTSTHKASNDATVEAPRGQRRGRRPPTRASAAAGPVPGNTA